MASASQRERILLIRLALVNKVGEGAAKHYGFEDDAEAPAAITTQSAQPTPQSEADQQPSSQITAGATMVTPASNQDESQGLHL